jgi:hypothetical protein
VAVDQGTLIVAGVMALSNMGGIALLARKYAASVDDHNKAIPAILESLKTLTTAQTQTAQHLDELFNGRNMLVERVNTVETTHEIRGCNLPINTRTGKDRRKDLE